MQSSHIFFTARERFDSSYGETWVKYLAFLGRNDLERVVTLDTILCPSVIDVGTQEDWNALVPDSTSLEFFTDLDHEVMKAAGSATPANVLAVIKEPDVSDLNSGPGHDFDFVGFDLVDKADEVSAILNSGGFPEVFSVDELSPRTGLIESYHRAFEIRDELVRQNPDEDHADCFVWGIWLRRS